MKNIPVFTRHIPVVHPYGRQNRANRLSCRFVTLQAHLVCPNPLPEDL